MKTAAATLGLAALVAALMLAVRPDSGNIPESPGTRARVCVVDVLDANRRPVHKLCSDLRAYERTTGRWRDVGPLTPLPGVPAR